MGKRNQPAVWGHRGASGEYPENTLLAFRKALEAGAAGLEFDVQKTADGRFVIIHDEELERTTSGSGKVGDFTLRELQDLDAGSGEPVPELAETLDALESYPGVTLDVELKEETLEPADFHALHELLAPESRSLEFLVSSFRHDLLIPFSSSGYSTGLLIGEQHEKSGIKGIRQSIRMVKPSHMNLPVEIYSRFPKSVRKVTFLYWRFFRRLKLVFWTVNTNEQYRMVRNVACAVITDHPGKIGN